jgi:hypothetical protein
MEGNVKSVFMDYMDENVFFGVIVQNTKGTYEHFPISKGLML